MSVPLQQLVADLSVAPVKLYVRRVTAMRTVEVTIEEATVELPSFEVASFHGSWSQLGEEASLAYIRALSRKLPALLTAMSVAGQGLKQAAVGSAGSSLAMLRFGGAAAGAV